MIFRMISIVKNGINLLNYHFVWWSSLDRVFAGEEEGWYYVNGVAHRGILDFRLLEFSHFSKTLNFIQNFLDNKMSTS